MLKGSQQRGRVPNNSEKHNFVLTFFHVIHTMPQLVAAGFAPWQVRPHIDSTSDQVLKIYLSLNEKKKRHCAHNETKPPTHVYFSFFNPLKVTGELELEILG